MPAPTAVADPSPSSGPHLVIDGGPAVEAGGGVSLGIAGMTPGWESVTVESPVLKSPVHLVPRTKGASESDMDDNHGYVLVRGDATPGTYTLTAISHGRTVATSSLAVTQLAPADVRRFGVITNDTVLGAPVRPGSRVVVLLADDHAAGDEDSLVATSPAFDKPLTIRTNSADDPGCKCDDGSTLYAGHTTVGRDVPAGTYPLTVVTHHGKQTLAARVTVAGEPVARFGARMWWATGLAVVLVLAGGAGFLAFRRRRRNRPA